MKPTRSVTAAASCVVLGMLAALTAAAPASADPVTSTGSLGSASVEVTFNEDTAAPGDLIIATIEFTNITGAPNDYTYELGDKEDSFGAVFELDGCAPAGACTIANLGTRVDVQVDDLPASGTTINAYLKVKDDAAPGPYPLSQALRGAESGVFLTPGYTVTVQESAADVAVDLDATAGPLLGSQITYDLTASNAGPADVTNATIDVQLPTQTNSVSNLPGGCTYDASSDAVRCVTGAIANGADAVKSFRANLGLLTIGQLSATASLVSSSPADPNGANNTSSAGCTVITSLIIICS